MNNKIKNMIKKETLARTVHFFKRYFIQTVIIVLLVLAFGFFELGRYTEYNAHPNLYVQDRATQTLQKISSLIQLPKGIPTMAIINNAASVKKTQPFLVNAKDGDVLIVYKNAEEALLYRPSTNKLITVGSITKIRTNTGRVPITTKHSVIAPISTNNATNTKSNK